MWFNLSCIADIIQDVMLYGSLRRVTFADRMAALISCSISGVTRNVTIRLPLLMCFLSGRKKEGVYDTPSWKETLPRNDSSVSGVVAELLHRRSESGLLHFDEVQRRAVHVLN